MRKNAQQGWGWAEKTNAVEEALLEWIQIIKVEKQVADYTAHINNNAASRNTGGKAE
jgi:hypothetical protein